MKRVASILTLVLAGAACLPVAAQADFGLDRFDLVFTSQRGEIVTQAGEHPFALEISWDSSAAGGEVEGRLRDLLLDLPPGLVAAPTSVPSCTREDFAELDEGVNDCPDITAVGIVATSFDEPGKWATAPVFNLVPSEGAVASLGFTVAGAENVVVDLGLSWDPPHRLLAVTTDFPEEVELFGAKLQLWGVPADPEHDGLRGQCGAYTTTLPPGEAADFEFEPLVGECPVNVAEKPFLTLPTSCEGPLATFYGALSWDDEEDFGSALTHDEAGDPQGLTGCGSVAFSPLIGVQPTTKEAKSPTGLDLTFEFSDEGLANPSGIAGSTVRELFLALPDSMTAAPTLTTGAGACTEADFAEESPEKEPDEGCPDTAEIGTIEVETPLLEGTTIEGTVNRAVPFANAAGDTPMALYVVLEDSGLGILVPLAVGIAPDPESGQLVAFAEELPQLPFGDLRLHLGGGPAEPLISPALCGDYETVVGFVPWADGSPYIATSAFEIASGPNGGPCPVEGGDTEDDTTTPPQGAAPASTPAIAGRASPRRRHRCPKGKHRVRRNGKLRCLKKHQRKAGRHRYP
jgi:hypothetical protein